MLAWGTAMITTRDFLQKLKTELEFLKNGGYRQLHSGWRAPYLFEESPSCPNFSDRSRPHVCGECWLIQFVPLDMRDEQIPCRFIQLAPNGGTVDSLYRYGTIEEAEKALRQWLQERIDELEGDLSKAHHLPFAANH